MGLYHLFGENKKAKEDFYNWYKNSGEACDYDLEHLENNLLFAFIDNTDQYVHFSNANILDWLEENDYYVGIKPNKSLNYATTVYKANNKIKPFPLYSNSDVKGRRNALNVGITKAIEDYGK